MLNQHLNICLASLFCFKSKKSKVLTADDIAKFLNEAPDNQYLITKISKQKFNSDIVGACRGGELNSPKVINIHINKLFTHISLH